MPEATINFQPGRVKRSLGIPWLPLLLWCLIVTTFASFRNRDISELLDYGGIDAQVKFQASVWAGSG